MKSINCGLQDLWDAACMEQPSVSWYEHYRLYSNMALGAHRVLNGEQQRIAWIIYKICAHALAECINQRNQEIRGSLEKLL